MKALVTGGTGFIGSHLVEHLLSRGYEVRCLVRKTSDLVWLKGLKTDLVYGDLFNDEALKKAVMNVDQVYHSAGLTKAKTREEYFRGNTTGTVNLLRAAMSHDPGIKRFVFISSQTAAGPSPTRTPITEEAEPHPITTYGRSKWEAEKECLKAAHSMPVTIIRPPVVYGPRDKDVFEFFRTVKKGLQPVVGFHEKLVSLVHVHDLVRGFVMAAENDASRGKTYFISSARVYGWKEIGETARRILGRRVLRLRIPEPLVYVVAAFAEGLALLNSKPALINFEKARDMVQDYWTCDASRARRDFGFEQQVSLEDGFRGTIEWYRQNHWL